MGNSVVECGLCQRHDRIIIGGHEDTLFNITDMKTNSLILKTLQKSCANDGETSWSSGTGQRRDWIIMGGHELRHTL